MSEKKAPSESLGWLSLVAKVLSILESLLPTFLLSWAKHNEKKNAELEAKLEHQKIVNDVQEKRHAVETQINAEDTRATIDRFLSK